MGTIKLQLNPEELKALATMAENELFRMKFVDPRFAGHTANPEVLRAAQSITSRLTEAMKKQRVFKVTPEHGQVQVRAAPRVSF